MYRFSLKSADMYQEVKLEEMNSTPLLDAAKTSASALRESAAQRFRFQPQPDALSRVSEHALEDILAPGREVYGVATERYITNAIPYGIRNVVETVHRKHVASIRSRFDAELNRCIRPMFATTEHPVFFDVSQYWYPPASYMGWHTNSRYPGWRLYVTYCAEPGRSFFRYRDPRSRGVVTSMDTGLDFRLFKVSAREPLWHAVYSETDRFSFGYTVRPWSPHVAVIRGLRNLQKTVGR